MWCSCSFTLMCPHVLSLVAAFLPSCQLGAIPAMRIALGVARSLACLSLAARPRSHLAAMSGAARPELCVFDLDACLWDKEMFQMSDVPEPSDVVRSAMSTSRLVQPADSITPVMRPSGVLAEPGAGRRRG